MRGVRAVLVVGLVGSVTWGLVGCGGGFFSSDFHPRHTIFTINGFVTVIQFTTIFDGRGGVIDVTLVTFEDDFGGFSTVTFCGTIGNQFLLDEFTIVDFTQGPPCATPLNITISV